MTAPRPRPELDIRIGGSPLAEGLSRCLASVVVRQALGRPAVAEATFEASGHGALPDVGAGAGLVIALRGGRPLFSGTIAGREHRCTGDGRRLVRLRAHDRLHGLRLKRRFRIHDGSVQTAWREAAGALGLDCETGEEGPRRQRVQNGVSDLAFLVSAAAEEGLYPVLHDERLHLVSLAGFPGTIDLTWGGELIEAAVDEAGERVARLARGFGWDADAAASFGATVPTARQDSEIELRGFGLEGLAAEDGEILLPNLMGPDDASATMAAQAMLDEAAAAQCGAAGLAAGDPAIRPGARLRLIGVAPAPVTVVATEALHLFDDSQGYVTRFSTEVPKRASLSSASAPVVTLGHVVDIADPEGGGRCKVALPAFGDLQLGHFSVLVPGAGPGKGLAALPDLGDRVVVLFPTGDLSQGLVLGGLYGALSRTPRGLTAQEPRSVVVASGGEQRLLLGGRDKRLSLSTAGGDVLGLGGGHSRLSVAGDLTISAVGGSITFKAGRIFFERGG